MPYYHLASDHQRSIGKVNTSSDSVSLTVVIQFCFFLLYLAKRYKTSIYYITCLVGLKLYLIMFEMPNQLIVRLF